MMKYYVNRYMKNLVFYFMLFSIIILLGISTVSKEKLMSADRLVKLYNDVNSLNTGVTEKRNYPNRIIDIDGKEYDLQYERTIVFDNNHIDGFFERHVFKSDEFRVTFINDSNEWESITFNLDDNRGSSLTFEERKKISLDYASKYIKTEGYVLKKSITEEKDISNYLMFTFVKLQNGYETLDRFSVEIRYDGKIHKIVRQGYGSFTNIQVPKIDKILLEKNVNEYVKQVFGDYFKLEIIEDNTVIRLDDNNIPFLLIDVRVTDNSTIEQNEEDNINWETIKIPVYCEDVKALN